MSAYILLRTTQHGEWTTVIERLAKTRYRVTTRSGRNSLAPQTITGTYERAKQAYCVIQTGERRFYGCFAFKKGVIPPDAG